MWKLAHNLCTMRCILISAFVVLARSIGCGGINSANSRGSTCCHPYNGLMVCAYFHYFLNVLRWMQFMHSNAPKEYSYAAEWRRVKTQMNHPNIFLMYDNIHNLVFDYVPSWLPWQTVKIFPLFFFDSNGRRHNNESKT